MYVYMCDAHAITLIDERRSNFACMHVYVYVCVYVCMKDACMLPFDQSFVHRIHTHLKGVLVGQHHIHTHTKGALVGIHGCLRREVLFDQVCMWVCASSCTHIHMYTSWYTHTKDGYLRRKMLFDQNIVPNCDIPPQLFFSPGIYRLYVCIYVCMHACMYVCMYEYMSVCVCAV